MRCLRDVGKWSRASVQFSLFLPKFLSHTPSTPTRTAQGFFSLNDRREVFFLVLPRMGRKLPAVGHASRPQAAIRSAIQNPPPLSLALSLRFRALSKVGMVNWSRLHRLCVASLISPALGVSVSYRSHIEKCVVSISLIVLPNWRSTGGNEGKKRQRISARG